MYQVVLRTLRDYESVWKPIPAMKPLVAEFERHLDAIQQTALRQSPGLAESRELKSALRSELETLTFSVAQAILAYGLQRSVPALINGFGWSASDFRRARQLDFANMVEQVIAQAHDLDVALNPNGVTKERLDHLANLHSRYREWLSWPRTAIMDRSAQCRALDQAFRAADRVLYEGIDLLINGLPGTELHFMYRSARRLAGAPRPKKRAPQAGTPPEVHPADQVTDPAIPN